MDLRRAHPITYAAVLTTLIITAPALAGGFPAQFSRVPIAGLQRSLQKFGYYKCPECAIDGDFNNRTKNALGEYLRHENLIKPGAKLSLGMVNRDPDEIVREGIARLVPNSILDHGPRQNSELSTVLKGRVTGALEHDRDGER